jgi:recombination DNA repair RAD52 pathway protein
VRLDDHLVDVLLRPIKPNRVQVRDGMSYVEAYDIRATMIRMFGFCGWSLVETSPAVCVFERETKIGQAKDKPGYRVAYRAHLALIVHLPDGDVTYAGSAVGEAVMPDYKLGDAHDMALKSAESGALKRAATNLGDQFGLSLYDNGSTKALVQRIVGYNDEPARAAADPPAAAAAPSGALSPAEAPEDDPRWTDPK